MRKAGVLPLWYLVLGLSWIARFRRPIISGVAFGVCVLAALYWIGVSAPPTAPPSDKSAPARDGFVSRISRPLTDPQIMQGILSRLATTLAKPSGQSSHPDLSSGVSFSVSQGRSGTPSSVPNPDSNPNPLSSTPLAAGQALSKVPAHAKSQRRFVPTLTPTVRRGPSQPAPVGPTTDALQTARGATHLAPSSSSRTKDDRAVSSDDGSSGQDIASPVGIAAGPSNTGKNERAPGNTGHARDASGEGNKNDSDPSSASRSGVGSGFGNSAGSNSDHATAASGGGASGSSSGSGSGSSTSDAGNTAGPNGVSGSGTSSNAGGNSTSGSGSGTSSGGGGNSARSGGTSSSDSSSGPGSSSSVAGSSSASSAGKSGPGSGSGSGSSSGGAAGSAGSGSGHGSGGTGSGGSGSGSGGGSASSSGSGSASGSGSGGGANSGGGHSDHGGGGDKKK
jgi:hypothetical protein